MEPRPKLAAELIAREDTGGKRIVSRDREQIQAGSLTMKTPWASHGRPSNEQPSRDSQPSNRDDFRNLRSNPAGSAAHAKRPPPAPSPWDTYNANKRQNTGVPSTRYRQTEWDSSQPYPWREETTWTQGYSSSASSSQPYRQSTYPWNQGDIREHQGQQGQLEWNPSINASYAAPSQQPKGKGKKDWGGLPPPKDLPPW